MPPIAAASGDAARRGDASDPPGRVASNTSFGGKREEEHHPDIVDPQVEWMRDIVLAPEVKIRPDHRCRGAREQQQRVVEDEADGPGARVGHGLSEEPPMRRFASLEKREQQQGQADEEQHMHEIAHAAIHRCVSRQC
jgi:hypothetical protein